MPPKAKRPKPARPARQDKKSDVEEIPLDAKPHTALLIPELLELIVTFAAQPYPDDTPENCKKGFIDLWCNFRAVCKFWKEIIETSTSPALAALTFTTKITVKDDLPLPTLTVCPLATEFLNERLQRQNPYWVLRRYCDNGWAARCVDMFRAQTFPQRFATYPAATGMRAKATNFGTTLSKRIQRVNSYYLKQRRTVVTWDEAGQYWYFEAESEITAQNFVAFTCGVYEAGGSNCYLDGTTGHRSVVPAVRIEFLRPDEGVVGQVEIRCKV
ncbi:hypothetical protein H072_6686 [Dactylellina haptotyla CBS 200.50]|uniref:Uncharacterized protein n=1 Tax=Dactylellina haptotyla (strain CBS 200.50) TaxID=1284197 RepID=S8AED9_DACHA|nr:hypothetical protein H072_6686 [Dactylellina haptotyla CBS 200.50]